MENLKWEILMSQKHGEELGEFIYKKNQKRGHSACFETLRKWAKLWNECKQDIRGFELRITGEGFNQ